MSEHPPRDESCKGQRWWVRPPGSREVMEVVVKDYDQNPPPHESSAIRFGPRKPLWLVESVTHRFVVGVVDNGEAQWSKTPPSP